ncbi:MAG TPA: transcriptional regulator [Candidatus Marinimicrobia bacterium]|nr:transcriptional regulator [Candidatus Neomarinimicrobiota bacterium]
MTQKESLNELIGVFTEIQDVETMGRFFNEIFTPKERDDFALRWRLLRDLHLGKAQRQIASELHLSLCKITRGSKVLKTENSITKKILKERDGDSDGTVK